MHISVADPGCLSRIRIISSRIRIFYIPDPGSASKNLSILTQTIVSKLSEIWSGLFIPDPDPDPDYLPIPDPWSRGQKELDPGSGSATPMYTKDRLRPTTLENVYLNGCALFWEKIALEKLAKKKKSIEKEFFSFKKQVPACYVFDRFRYKNWYRQQKGKRTR